MERIAKNFDIQLLYLFIAIVEEGSFNLASESVTMSQPALTQRMMGLENILGVPLFVRDERHRKTTKLTEKGKQVYLYAKITVVQFEVMIKCIQETDKT